MVFSSAFFIFLFLPIVLGLYYVAKEKYRNYILLVASLFFYAYGEPKFVLVMIASILVNYLLARLIGYFKDRGGVQTGILVADIVFNIGLLFVYKYLDFSIEIMNRGFGLSLPFLGIALPIGISFFTFQAMSYVIDVYRKRAEVQKNLFHLALYISFFPQLIAGPIVRYNSIEEQICKRSISMDKFGMGVQRFLQGFAKKVILANNLALVAEQTFGVEDFSQMPVALAWIGSICFTLQIYYDFSGYSDMAIGLGKMFGFEFEENFNYPYISKSITEFWRRWHISLGQWFRDYVYIPLGGSRCGVVRQILNLFVVWLLTGIWHGANYTFIVWGLGYFLLLLIEKLILKPDKRNVFFRALWMVVTLFLVNIGWVIFNSRDLLSATGYLGAMFGYYKNESGIGSIELVQMMREYGGFILLGIIFAFPVANKFRELIQKSKVTEAIGAVLIPFGYFAVFFWAISYIILGAHNPFIYFNF